MRPLVLMAKPAAGVERVLSYATFGRAISHAIVLSRALSHTQPEIQLGIPIAIATKTCFMSSLMTPESSRVELCRVGVGVAIAIVVALNRFELQKQIMCKKA